MNTFLPYADFMESAKVIDKKRCWKQVVEAKQIINILETKANLGLAINDYVKAEDALSKVITWSNHPAVKMWEGYIEALKHYYNIFLSTCLTEHKINTKLEFISCKYSTPEATILHVHQYWTKNEKPWWLGNEDFHRAMRSRLIEKDREFYLPLFPNDEGFNGGKYFWPVMETKTFRTI
jgi:hypothetical protein